MKKLLVTLFVIVLLCACVGCNKDLNIYGDSCSTCETATSGGQVMNGENVVQDMYKSVMCAMEQPKPDYCP